MINFYSGQSLVLNYIIEILFEFLKYKHTNHRLFIGYIFQRFEFLGGIDLL